MTTSAIITLLTAHILVTGITIYFFVIVLKKPNKKEIDEPQIEN